MVARDFYAHTAPDGSRPWDRAAAAGSRCRTVGENIACGQRSAAEVVRGWMNSPGHRANILRPEFTRIGVGLAGGGRAGTYWTQLFGGLTARPDPVPCRALPVLAGGGGPGEDGPHEG